jgi:hypothetical protein
MKSLNLHAGPTKAITSGSQSYLSGLSILDAGQKSFRFSKPAAQVASVQKTHDLDDHSKKVTEVLQEASKLHEEKNRLAQRLKLAETENAALRAWKEKAKDLAMIISNDDHLPSHPSLLKFVAQSSASPLSNMSAMPSEPTSEPFMLAETLSTTQMIALSTQSVATSSASPLSNMSSMTNEPTFAPSMPCQTLSTTQVIAASTQLVTKASASLLSNPNFMPNEPTSVPPMPAETSSTTRLIVDSTQLAKAVVEPTSSSSLHVVTTPTTRTTTVAAASPDFSAQSMTAAAPDYLAEATQLNQMFAPSTDSTPFFDARQHDRVKFANWLRWSQGGEGHQITANNGNAAMTLRYWEAFVSDQQVGGINALGYNNAKLDQYVQMMNGLPKNLVDQGMAVFNTSDAADCWVQQETWKDDLRACLTRYEHESGVSLNWAPFKEASNRHEPSQEACQQFYTPDLSKSVLSSDRHLFELFGYQTCCGPRLNLAQ